jgi:chromosomal replication initiator protein
MKVTSESIRAIVNGRFKIDISSKCRERRFIDPRFIYALLCKKYTLESTTRIGLTINRHHASILHAIKQGEIYLEQDKEFETKYLTCKKLVDDRLIWKTNTTIPLASIL